MPTHDTETSLSAVLMKIARLLRREETTGVRRLLTPRQFHAALTRERGRSDRNGHPFALVIFNTGQPTTSKEPLQDLARQLAGRIRQTDEAGYLDDNHIGVILPYTPSEGARTFAEDVCQRVARSQSSVSHSIHVYPHDESTDGGGRSRLLVSGLRQRRVELQRTRGSTLPAGFRSNDQPISLVGAAALAEGDQPAGRGESGLSFIEPMPIWKRILDVTGAIAGLTLLSPLMLVAAIATKLSSPGPVFFSQMRAGLGGRPFRFYKFRTMVRDAEALKESLLGQNDVSGPVFKMRHDPRVTCVGRFLRKTSIDELPQLWNVLKADMTLVGPRPLPVDETAGCTGWQHRRLCITPGLTCIWQISGRSDVSFDEWIRMDLRYVRSRCLWMDITILARTLGVVLKGKGAY